MAKINDTMYSIKESVSTIFRHILPGILIIGVSNLSKPLWTQNLDVNSTSSLVILGSIAMVIGNVWYVFHRYVVLQIVDCIAYYYRFPGQPKRVVDNNYRGDLAKHVSNYFSTFSKQIAMGKHIRDRFSSFNFMFLVSEVIIIFTLISDGSSFLRENYFGFLIIGFLGFISAIWQYLIVRVIDEEFTKSNTNE